MANLATLSNPPRGNATGFGDQMDANLTQLRTNDQLIEDRVENSFRAMLGDGIVSGSFTAPLLGAGTGFQVNLAACAAVIGFYFTQSASVFTVPASSTSHLYLFQDGTLGTNTTGTNPGTTANPAIELGTATTSGSAVTSVTVTANLVLTLTGALAAALAGSGDPVGTVKTFAGTGSIPSGYLECDGSSLLRSAYPALFTAIGTTYGTVDGTHFTLPDTRGRWITHAGGVLGVSVGSTGGAYSGTASITGTTGTGAANLNTTGGGTYTSASESAWTSITYGTSGSTVNVSLASHTHTHDVTVPSHTHTDSGHTHGFSASATVNTIPPYVAMRQIIRVS